MSETNTKVITGEVRFSYAHVWEPKAHNEGDKPKYSVSIIIPKTDKTTLDKMDKAIAAATAEGKASKWGGKVPGRLKTPLRDGDDERPDDPAYANAFFLNASSLSMPGIIDTNRNEILDKDEFYSGCYGKASLNFYAFSANGNKGVAVGLNNLLKTKDGEPLGSVSVKAEDDFANEFDAADDMM